MPLLYEPDMTKFADEIQVNEVNLDECALNQASLLAYYLNQKALAERQVKTAQLNLNMYYFTRKREVEAELTVKEKRVTEGSIDSIVKTEEEYIKRYWTVVESERIRDQLQACCSALHDRKKTIQQLLDARLVQAGGSVTLNSRKSF